jgi:hypothetical protein
MIICCYEDRLNELIGLKLLISSLARHVPDAKVLVTYPPADASFRDWLRQFPQVTLDDNPALAGMGFDIKPTLLLRLLDAGHDSVVWMDSDIIVTSDFRKSWTDPDVLVVTEERPLRQKHVVERVEGWKLTVGRKIPAINSCVIRARPAHRPLLEAWRRLLASPEYQSVKSVPWPERKPHQSHLLGDQDVLTALLASTQFADVKLQVLQRSKDIVQHFHVLGYPPHERLLNLVSGMPPLIHSQGPKPWHHAEVPSLLKDSKAYFQHLYLQTSPYSHFARQYRDSIGDFPGCFEITTLPGRISNAVGLGHPSTSGFLQSLWAWSWSWTSKVDALARKLRG